MDQTQLLTVLTVLTAVAVLALLVHLRRQRRDAAPEPESMYAASTEGEKRCPKCGMGNLWTDRNCISCKARLPG
jgi:hypothetical protein